MKSFLDYAKRLESLAKEARAIEGGNSLASEDLALSKRLLGRGADDDAKKVLIFSPHPDDECLVGALPLRLCSECGCRVRNVAVTLGSKKLRRISRFEELKGACAFLGWGLTVCGECGFESMNACERGSESWNACAGEIASIIRAENPAAVFFPHEKDANNTHMCVSMLVRDALGILGNFGGAVVTTEYWSAHDAPNMMVEVSPEILAALVCALSFHRGEVERNDYHVRLPAWMSDNVRRGAELVGGQGAQKPDFEFAVLYRLGKFENGEIRFSKKKRLISNSDRADSIFTA